MSEEKIVKVDACTGQRNLTTDMENRFSENENAKFHTYNAVLNYLTSSSYPINSNKDEKRKIRAKSKRFYISQGGKLMVATGRQCGKEIITSSAEAQKIMHQFHDERGHLGRDKTYYAISELYFWDGLYGDVDFYIRSCLKCQMVNPSNFNIGMSELHPIAITSPWYHIGMDLVLLPETKTGNKYLFTMCDYFTKWPEAVPIPDKSAGTVSLALYKVCLRMGFPSVYSSDQGREFVNQVMEELKQITNSKQRLSTAYHPQTNGLVERFNQTIQRMLLKCCSDTQDDWDEYVEECLYGYRTSIQSSSKVSPFEAMFGRKPTAIVKENLPQNSIIKEVAGNEDDADCEALEYLTEHRKRLYEKIESNVKLAQSKQKEQYKAKRLKQGGVTFMEGEKVLIFNSRKDTRKGSKLENTWTGPYIIAESMGKNVYRLKSTAGKVLKTKYNGCKLKRFMERSATDAGDTATLSPGCDSSISCNTNEKEQQTVTSFCEMSKQDNIKFFSFPPRKILENIAKDLHLNTHSYVYGNVADSLNVPLGPPKDVFKIIGDGNCFYRSISQIITGSESQHLLIRNEVVKHMATEPCKKKLEDYLNIKDITDYIDNNKVGDNGTWATDAEIIATASLLQTDIEVYSCDLKKENNMWLRYPASFSLSETTPYAIFITNQGGIHFDVVTSVKEISLAD